ncbi:receptor-type tyrosine-protein phosphatase eta-like [Pelodytes ibericus]
MAAVTAGRIRHSDCAAWEAWPASLALSLCRQSHTCAVPRRSRLFLLSVSRVPRQPAPSLTWDSNITYLNGSLVELLNINDTSITGLISGTLYTVYYGSSSQSCCANITTKPLPVTQVQTKNMTSDSISLIWDQPVEYQSYYTYRVQTKNTSSTILISETTVTSESALITNLTPGETYTFTVFTRAGDNVTESQPVSYITCTAPGAAQTITVTNNKSTNSLGVTWTKPNGMADNYTVALTGEINRTITTSSTQYNIPDLLPGREYSITIQTVSGNCSQTAAPVTEATYPTSPDSVNFTNIGTNSISLSWGEPMNMANVTKNFTITYSNGSVTGTVSSNTLNVTLQSLTSGTNYTITVVTVGVRLYQSSGVSRAVYTKPLPVTQVRTNNVTSNSVSLIWDKPADYQSYYTYRVQTTTTSSIIPINETTVTSESALITNLTPGETYTFTVFTRAGDNVTESQPVSYITCTAPGAAQTITVTNNQSTNSLGVTWTKPNGKADNYTVALTGEINRTITTSSTQYNIPDLLPGREYSITIQTVSGNCSQTAAPVTEATYPTQPGSLTFTNIGTNSISLSWGEPMNMANVTKNFTITYSNGSVTGTVSSNTLNVILQSLTSGTNYTITVVTVGVRLYQSSGVSRAVYTKPLSVTQVRTNKVTSNSVSLIWNKPGDYQSYYTYRVQTTTTSSIIPINETTVTSESALITNLTPGETYTFTVFTRAGDNVTESQPVSYITCTAPGAAQTITVTNNQSTNSLGVTWTKPNGKVNNYTVALTGEINRTITTSSTQYNIPDLLPGREYSITIQTVSGNCSQTAAPVTEATYPTQPGSLNFTNIGTNSISLSWGEPMNMANVTKNFTTTYSNGSVTGTVSSNTLNVTLQSLTSGTNYTITVVTVGVRLYQSSGVSRAVYTSSLRILITLDLRICSERADGRCSECLENQTFIGDTEPLSVTQVRTNKVTSNSVSLIWDKPVEYQSYYTYRVQTTTTSSIIPINETTVTSESALITNLTPGETYTFTVFTRAGDNVTESQSVSYIICIAPGAAQTITVTNNKSTNSLGVTWTKPNGMVNNYTVALTGEINRTITTSSTQYNIPDLLPGREYSITIQTVSGNCSQTAAPVTEATYPTQPGSLNFTNIGTNSISLSWGEPMNMANVTKNFTTTYSNGSVTGTVSSNTLNVTLQSLTSGTNYTITVVTVGVRLYQSSGVSRAVYTKPLPVTQVRTNNVTSNSVSLIWDKPADYQSYYTYRLFSVPATVSSFSCTPQDQKPELLFTWQCPAGLFTSFNITITYPTGSTFHIVPAACSPGALQTLLQQNLQYYTDYSIGIVAVKDSCEKTSSVLQIPSCWTSITVPPDVSVSTVQWPKDLQSFNQLTITFQEFNNSHGPLKAYAVIVTTEDTVTGQKPSPGVLSKTYNDFKSGAAKTYVSLIVETGQRAEAIDRTVRIGDNTETHGYLNGPLKPLTTYRVSIAGFTRIKYDTSKNTMLEDRSLLTYAPYSSGIQTNQDPGVIAGAVVGCILGAATIGIMGFFIWRKRRQGEKKSKAVSVSKLKLPAMSTVSFANHFTRQQADSNLGFRREYESFASVGVTQSKTAAENPDNRSKNRYTNVLPYDISRVKLSIVNNPTDDYINANYIPGSSSDKEFIAAQGPLPQTVSDFWRMVWEKKISTIVMLTKCLETGKVKCEEYWPSNQTEVFNKISVSLKTESVLPDWTIRDFKVTNNNSREHLQVRHFHFTAWPDHGVPKTTNVLINFRNVVCDYVKNCPDTPILVHCSAGVGRTGTLIALDRIIRQMESEDKVDVYGVVYDLRMHRGLMVQTDSQYIFLNECALDFINSKGDQKPDLIYQNTGAVYENLSLPSRTFRTNV